MLQIRLVLGLCHQGPLMHSMYDEDHQCEFQECSMCWRTMTLVGKQVQGFEQLTWCNG